MNVGESAASEFRSKDHPIYLLFNAWCKDDQVFLDKNEEKQEYVLNEKGLIWYGNWRQLGRRPWNFNQFEKSIFEIVMYLLVKHVSYEKSGTRLDVLNFPWNMGPKKTHLKACTYR